MTKEMIEKIDEVVHKINTHPEYSRTLKSRSYNTLLCEASRHSSSMELEAQEIKGRRKEAKLKRDLEHLRQAWDYLSKYKISISTLAKLGNLIEPETHVIPNFRNGPVVFGPFSPPEHYIGIAQAVSDLVRFLGSKDLHPVLSSIEAHVEMVRIHPYLDGNGRAARLLQCYVLEENDYPPAIILPSEREVYISLLGRTLDGRYHFTSSFEKPSDDEILFRKFLESKVLGSATRVENELKASRQYGIELRNLGEIGMAHSIANTLRHYGRNGNGIKVHIYKPSRHGGVTTRLDVIGDVSKASLTDFLSKQKERYKRFSYEVHTVRD